MGVWIETQRGMADAAARMSHPVWVCGLKHVLLPLLLLMKRVTPCMGVWIETEKQLSNYLLMPVTPCMGVWIETLLKN